MGQEFTDICLPGTCVSFPIFESLEFPKYDRKIYCFFLVFKIQKIENQIKPLATHWAWGIQKFLSSLEIKKNRCLKTTNKDFQGRKRFYNVCIEITGSSTKCCLSFKSSSEISGRKTSQVAMSGESLLAFTSIEHSCTKYASLCSFKERFSSEFSVRISTFTTT